MELENRIALGLTGLGLVIVGVAFGWLTLHVGAQISDGTLPARFQTDLAALALTSLGCGLVGGFTVICASINPRQRRLRRRARAMARYWHR